MDPSTTLPARHDDIDNYDAGDLSDDPFASPPPDSAAKKRKANGDGGLGIDEEVSVQKRARVPNVKLDEDRLLGPAGLPKLKARASGLKIKGKGHEFSDAARLLSFYQLWLDDLFPKAKFLDALAMVEKAGHKKRLASARNEWISQGRPKDKTGDDDEDFGGEEADINPTRSAAHFTSVVNGSIDRPSTPQNDDVPDDDDLYDATPRAARQTRPQADIPEDDDLDALMAEEEMNDCARRPPPKPTHDKGDDELDALIAEAEGADRGRVGDARNTMAGKDGKKDDDFAEEEAAMQEMDGLW